MGDDFYTVTRKVKYENGMVQEQGGKAILYGEFHLTTFLSATPFTGKVDGVFDLDADSMTFSGKWWTIVQDTNAYGDEVFVKGDAPAAVGYVFPQAIMADGSAQSLTLAGANLPKVSAGDISFADPKVKVTKVVSADEGAIVCHVEAAKGAMVGACGIKVKGAACDEQVTVYDKLDAIKIFPRLGRARVSSGPAYPAHGVQFLARGINYGKDGAVDTADDLILEAVDAEWWLEEEKTRDNDDDLKYLMAPIINGLYVPVTTYGPIEERVQRREGIGLIAVGASYEGMKSRALLGVTDPDYVPHFK
jgi:hypothetical protein